MYSRILFISIFAEKIKKEGIKLILKYNTLIQHKHKAIFKSLIIFHYPFYILKIVSLRYPSPFSPILCSPH